MTISSAVHSQAFSFLSYLTGGVDPRTGLYNFSINLPELQCNQLSGPDLPVDLAFNSLNTRDSGYGLGWNFRLSQFTPGIDILALSTGETFKVTGSGQTPDIKEKKLDSFKFENNQDGTYRVLHKSGLIETLKVGGSEEERVALPCMIQSPSGHSVTLEYTDFKRGQRLESIRDGQGEVLLQINRPNDFLVELLLHPYAGPQGGPLARYQLKLNSSGWVTEIVLPTDENASWRLGYGDGLINGFLCLQDIKTPVGGHETIEYRDEGHPFPVHMQRPNLPRVTRHLTDPGFGQPEMEMIYSYDHLNNSSNFLGYGTATPVEEGLDTLYEAPAEYVYGTRARLMDGGAAVRQVDRTFNRFHLLLKETTTQDHCIQEVLTTYYADDRSFEFQDPRFQLVKHTQTSWKKDNSNDYRAEEVSSQYDVHGNVVEEIQANGIRSVYSYYPMQHVGGFVRELKDTTVYPSPLSQGDAPILRTRLTYTELPAVAGSGLKNWLAVGSETLLLISDDAGETELEQQQTLHYYNNDPQDFFLHGRPNRQDTVLNGKAITTDYKYQLLDSLLAGEMVLQTVETITGWDNSRKEITREDSLFHAQPLLTYDDNNVTIRYTYDALVRVTSETVAPGHPEYEATRNYEYFLTSVTGGQAEQVLVDVKGVKTRTRFDGLNRAIYEERQNADSAVSPEAFRQTYAALHDALGNRVVETVYDWRDEEQVPQSSDFEYDAWGNLRCTTGPDRVKVYEETDPIGTPESQGPIQRSWREGTGTNPLRSGVEVTWLNLYEKPTRTLRLESLEPDAKVTSVRDFVYDGLGRTKEETDPLKARTQYGYDVFDRMIATTLPGGAIVRRSYDPYSTEDRPIEISVNAIVLGKQAFDALGRMTKSITGGREQTFTYKAGEMQPQSVTTADLQIINYEYQPLLGEEPVVRRLPNDVDAQYIYDEQNARLKSCKEQGQELKRQYFSTGELKSESRQLGDEVPNVMHYNHSRQGLLLSYIDVLNNTQRYHYDEAGRLQFTEMVSNEAGTEVTTLVSNFTYDGLGQTQSIETQDCVSGQNLTTTLEYDVFGRETVRTFDLNGIIQQMTQVYNENDLLVQRNLREGKDILRMESYEYDPRGRLEIYKCKGSQPPVDPYGKAIAKQLFRFDAVDNIIQVITEATDGTINDARYTFDTVDPTQLHKVTNSAGEPYPSEILLDYDRNGNLIRDEEKRILEYDALNRLLSVSEHSGGGSSDFDYDALDKLSGLNGGTEQRFYQNGELATRIDGKQHQIFVRAVGNLLAEQQEGAGPKLQLLASDQKNTVLKEISSEVNNDIAYSVYGHRSAETPVSTHLGYNGVLREAQTGFYLLGNGYRAYNPCLMRFHSPDSWSPFGRGGLNSYVFCEGDSINKVDLDGHAMVPVFIRNLFNRFSALFRRSPSAAAPMNYSNRASGSSVEPVSPSQQQSNRLAAYPAPPNRDIQFHRVLDETQIGISRDNPIYKSTTSSASSSRGTTAASSMFSESSSSSSSSSSSARSSVVDQLYEEFRAPGGGKMQTLDRKPRAREPLPREKRTRRERAPSLSQLEIRNIEQARKDKIELARRTEGKRL